MSLAGCSHSGIYTATSFAQPHGLSYGIAYHGADGKQIVLEDISCNQEFVSKMAEIFTLCQLPPDRFKRAVIELLP